jgi:hypothetical protein
MSTTTGPGRPVRHVKGLMQDARQVGDVLHEVVVLGAMARDADRVAFLEGIRADEMGRHLPGDAHDRDRIEKSVGEPRDDVGGARPGRDEEAADLAGRARIAFGRMRGALLVAHQDVAQLFLMEKRVIDRQHGSAGIAEDMLDALVFQRAHHHLGACHLLQHGPSPSSNVRGRRCDPISAIKKALSGAYHALALGPVVEDRPLPAPPYENQIRHVAILPAIAQDLAERAGMSQVSAAT